MEHIPLSNCPRCSSHLLDLDTDFLADANQFGALPYVPLMYYCWGCHHRVQSFIREPLPPDPDIRRCDNCWITLPKGRRRFCSIRCSRPTKATQIKIDRERLRRQAKALESE
jgi:hypothetical protein